MRGNKLFKLIDRYAGIPLLYILKAAGFIFPFQRFVKREFKTCLVIKQSALGDTILMLPAIKKIKESGYRVVMVATRVNEAAARACGYIDELLIFEPSWVKSPFKMIKFIKDIYNKKAFIALDFDQWLRVSPLLAFFSGAVQRIGFETKGQYRAELYTKKVKRQADRHELENFMEIVRAAGIEVNQADKKLFFQIKPEEKSSAEDLKKKFGLVLEYAVIHPGCGSHGFQRQWPEERYAEIVKFLESKGIITAATAGPDELGIYEKIRELSGCDLKLIKTETVGELAHIISGAKVFISGNTGIMHLAAAVGVPVVAIHGPTDALKWGPYSEKAFIVKAKIDCSPCLDLGFEYGCKERKCMESISVDAVKNAVMKLIQ